MPLAIALMEWHPITTVEWMGPLLHVLTLLLLLSPAVAAYVWAARMRVVR